MNENDIMDYKIGCRSLWKGKYKFGYCELCECFHICCPDCNNISCSGAGCELCNEDFRDFNKNVKEIRDYLNEEEKKTLKKISHLKNLITSALNLGDYEINWKKMHETGHLCVSDYKIFELDKIGLNYENIAFYIKNQFIP